METSHFVETNGLRHHVLSYGSPDAAPLLFVPGITSPAITAGFIARWLAQRYRVLVPDLRGRGDTDTPGPGNYTLKHYAGDMAGVLGAFGRDGMVEEPVLLGHSLGARIVAAYRVEYGAERSPAVLVDPPVSGPGRSPYPTSRESFAAQLDEAARGTTAGEIRKYYPHWPQAELELRARVLHTCDKTAVLETHENFHREDFFTYWQKTAPPAVLIRGMDSPVVGPDAAAELAETNPAVPIKSVEHAGHMIPWDNFDGFRSALGDSLAGFGER